MKHLLADPIYLFLIGFFLPSPRQTGILLRQGFVAIVKLVAITAGQTEVKDYIEDHFHRKPNHRPNPGTTAEPER